MPAYLAAHIQMKFTVRHTQENTALAGKQYKWMTLSNVFFALKSSTVVVWNSVLPWPISVQQIMYTHYAQFLEYIWTKADAAAIDNEAVMQKLSNKFKWKQEHDVPKLINVEHKNISGPTPETTKLTNFHSIGIENKQSNCWLNSILQCESIICIPRRYTYKICWENYIIRWIVQLFQRNGKIFNRKKE
jgi:hypothetical protein